MGEMVTFGQMCRGPLLTAVADGTEYLTGMPW